VKNFVSHPTDDGTHWETWQCLCRVLERCDFLYVADCKLCVSQTLLRLDKQGGRFITVLPRNRSEVGAFAEQAATCQVRWEPLWSRRSARKYRHRETFDLAAGLYQMQEAFAFTGTVPRKNASMMLKTVRIASPLRSSAWND
jgi:hypothetical protein